MRANEVGPFLKWARRRAPALYAGIMRDVPGADAFAGHQLAGFADSLANIAKSVGSYVAKNSPQLIDTAGKLVLAKQQVKIARATGTAPTVSPEMAQPFFPATGSQQGGQLYPLGYPVDYSQQVTPSPFARKYAGLPLWAWLAGAAGFGLIVWRSRR